MILELTSCGNILPQLVVFKWRIRKKCSHFENFNKRRIAMENDELYMGGFRCSMCNWFDETKDNYFILNWFVAILHPIVHSIEAHKALG